MMVDFGDEIDANPLDAARKNRAHREAAQVFNQYLDGSGSNEIDRLGLKPLDPNPLGPYPTSPALDHKQPPPLRPEEERDGRLPFVPDKKRPDEFWKLGKSIKQKAPVGRDMVRGLRFWRTLWSNLKKLTASGCFDEQKIDPNPLDPVREGRNWRELNRLIKAIEPNCIDPPCYELESSDGSYICTTTNLLQYVGSCIEVGGVCYTVTKSINTETTNCENCTSTTTVTVGDTYDGDSDCSDCETEHPPSTADPCDCTYTDGVFGDCDHNCTCTADCYTVTISGVTDCPCVNSGGGSFQYVSASNVNGAHQLVYSNDCEWSLVLSNAMEFREWDSTEDCAGSPDTTTQSDITLILSKVNGTTWRLRALTNTQIAFQGETTVPDGGCGFAVIDSGFAADDCGDGVDLGGGSTRLIRAYSGTATVEACCA